MSPRSSDLTNRSSHFEFGKNWAAYADQITDGAVDSAAESIRRLVPDISGKSFLDIGSGSGLFSVAALRLGAARVHAVDIDENSVGTTRRVLARFAPNKNWTAEQKSVFDLSADDLGEFDVVYSWGVLHHTGAMWRAIACAAKMTAPGGIFVFALYERTPLCGAWRVEKRIYTNSPKLMQRVFSSTYKSIYSSALFLAGRGDSGAREARGMTLEHDVHDWLGGYPYESTDAEEVEARLGSLGFERVLNRPAKVHLGGLFGTGNSEYVYRRRS